MSSFSEYNIDQFKKIRCCPNCGDKISIQTGICPSCRSEYKDIKNSFSDLEEFLLQNMKNDIPLDTNNTHHLALLYSLQNECHSKIVEEFLKRQQVEEKIEGFMKKINDKLLANNALNEEENHIFANLLEDAVLKSNQILGHYIMKGIFLKHPLVSKETYFALVKQMAIETMKEINAGRIPNYHPRCVIENMEKDVKGGAHRWYEVIFDYDMLSEVYKGNFLNFQTFFHEIDHVLDAINIHQGVFSVDIVKHIQEKVIRQIEGKQAFLEGREANYYDKNYDLISYEKDAQIHGYIAFRRYLEMLGIGISKGFDEAIQKVIDYEIKQKENELRTIDGDEFINQNYLTVDDIFECMIEDYPWYLNYYSQLRIGYIVDNGKVRRKTNEELINTYLGLDEECYDEEYRKYITMMIVRNKEQAKKTNYGK